MAENVWQNYAEALYGLSKGPRLSEYREAVADMDQRLREDRDFLSYLASYDVEAGEKRKACDAVFGAYGLPYLADFMKVVIDHHRIHGFPEIAREYRSLADEELGIAEGICYSAKKLSSDDLKRLEELFAKKIGKKVSLENRVDQSLLGGVKVALEGKVYDGTLRSRLLGLRKSLDTGGAQ